MLHRRLGRSGLRISEIAYGNWITHGAQIDQEQALACTRAALDAGITTFDTADAYADSRAEEVLGLALAGVRRESVEILTKLYWPTGPGANERGLSRKHVMEAAHASLRRLGTDYIDVYQAHRYDDDTPLEETLRAFDDLIRQGKVLYVGVSEWSADQIRRALSIADSMCLDRIVSNQPQYNLLRRTIEADVVPLCSSEGIGQIVYQPLAQGVLAGKYLPGQPPPAGSRATDETGSEFIGRLLYDDLLERIQRLKPLAADAGLSLAQLSIAWVLQQPGISSAIVGGSRPSQLADSAAASGIKLDPELLDAIDTILGDTIERTA
ncbi:aldo/keto reductase family protein [Kribbella sp. NPDC050124]|uniref:aldo/keto reductase family protein n=1 Tax=Kribbella sp. NPDC050124 TaxID=3364114 RepID=UPI00378D2D10